MRDKDIYQIDWMCEICGAMNKVRSDIFFRYFCVNDSYDMFDVDVDAEGDVVYIEIGLQMLQAYNRVKNMMGREINFRKAEMMGQSFLLESYMKGVGLRERLRSVLFDYDKFMRDWRVSKLEYCLWFVDYLRVKLEDVRVKFYYHGDDHGNDDFIGKLKEKIGFDYFERVLKRNGGDRKYGEMKIERFDRIKERGRVIFMSVTCLDRMLGLIEGMSRSREEDEGTGVVKRQGFDKVYLINLEEQVDVVSLQSTSTGVFLDLWNVNYRNKNRVFDSDGRVRVYDYRIFKDENYKGMVDVIREMMFGLRQSLNVYVFRENTRMWERVVEGSDVRRFIEGNERLEIYEDNFEKGTYVQIVRGFVEFMKGRVSYESVKEYVNEVISILMKRVKYAKLMNKIKISMGIDMYELGERRFYYVGHSNYGSGKGIGLGLEYLDDMGCLRDECEVCGQYERMLQCRRKRGEDGDDGEREEDDGCCDYFDFGYFSMSFAEVVGEWEMGETE